MQLLDDAAMLNDPDRVPSTLPVPPPVMLVLLASDLVYELRNVEPLVDLIRRVLEPGGVCLMTDQDRVPSQVLREALPKAGLTFTAARAMAGQPGGQRFKGTLYRITKPGA